MDVSKIEKLIADLIKHGDKKTMKIVSDLLVEISLLDPTKKTDQKQTQQKQPEQPKVTNESLATRASSVLDSLSSYGGSSIFSQPSTPTPQPRPAFTQPKPTFRQPQAPQNVPEDYSAGFSSMFGAAPQPQAPVPSPVAPEGHNIPDIPYTPAPPVQGFDSAITNYAALL